MAYTAQPILNGISLPRPNSASESPEQVGTRVELANGRTVPYVRGLRMIFALGWAKLTEAERTALLSAYSPGASSYVSQDGTPYVVLADPPQWTPVPGTDPVRFDASITLREQTPRA